MTLNEYIIQVVNATLEKNHFNISKTAQELQITRNTVHKYMKNRKLKKNHTSQTKVKSEFVK